MANTLKKTLSGRNVVVANAEVFIVPNRASLASDYFSEDHKKKVINDITEMCTINGKEYRPDVDRLIQLWYVSADDLETDNMGDHGFNVYDSEGNKYRCTINRLFANLPAIVLPSKEGETVTITLPGCTGRKMPKDRRTETISDDSNVEFDLILNLTANQESYRYCRFGTFEHVMKEVC